MQISCAIIDDEPLAIELLSNYVSRIPFLNLTGKYTSAVDALENIRNDHTQLLFLDIQMPDLNGLEFSRLISPDTKVIFTTAFSEYALESYKIQALDYLLKPISFQDFLSAADRALKWFEIRSQHEGKESDKTKPEAKEDELIYVRSEHRLVAINLTDIEYIEALKDYVMIHIVGQKSPIYTITTMHSMETKLPPNRFMRVHRSFIIALKHISALEGDTVIVANRHIPVSRGYRTALLDYLQSKTV